MFFVNPFPSVLQLPPQAPSRHPLYPPGAFTCSGPAAFPQGLSWSQWLFHWAPGSITFVRIPLCQRATFEAKRLSTPFDQVIHCYRLKLEATGIINKYLGGTTRLDLFFITPVTMSSSTPSPTVSATSGVPPTSRRPPRKSTLTQQQKNQKRQRATQDQLLTLEVEFNKNPTPTATVRERIAQDISMTERSVQIWFQNRWVLQTFAYRAAADVRGVGVPK